MPGFLGGTLGLAELAHVHEDAQHARHMALRICDGGLDHPGLAPRRIGMQHLGFKERLPAFGKQFSGVQPLNLRFIGRQQIRQ